MFLEVIGATGAAPVKPDPRAVMHRIDPIFGQGRRDDALMVGDTGADMAFARAIGVASCWVSYGYGRPEDLRRLQPTLTAASLRDVAAHALETKAPT
ncbi:MAG: HAD family hydrolase [Rhodoblastus sp.]|nr:MAG: HAD family hydrolase [Rhodoblastus sp.]